MSERRVFHLVHATARQRAIDCVRDAPDGYKVEVKPAGRSLDQNAAQWPYLEAFSSQLKWPVNGNLVSLEPEEWKDILTSAFFGESVRLAQGLNGGLVMLGKRTSKFSKHVFSEWIDFLAATAAQKAVQVKREENDA